MILYLYYCVYITYQYLCKYLYTCLHIFASKYTKILKYAITRNMYALLIMNVNYYM